MHILLTGASGFIGQHLLKKLLEQGHHVYACSRIIKKSYHDKLTWFSCDFNQDITVDSWLGHLENIDIVINTVGIIQQDNKNSFEKLHIKAPVALFKACQQKNIHKIIQISALGADENAQTAYHISKYQAQQQLQTLIPEAVILQPSIVIGGKSTDFFASIAQMPIIFLIGQGEQKIQPVLIQDLTQAVINIIKQWPEEKIIPIVGYKSITFKELLEYLRLWQGLTSGFYISLPKILIKTLAKINDFIKIGLLNSDTYQMLERGNSADTKVMIENTYIIPQNIKTYFQNNPASQAKRWHLGLLFLKPMLWLTIAFVWIFTGITSAFLYPLEKSYALLAAVGLQGFAADIALYSAAFLDILMGIFILLRFKLGWVISFQIAMMLTYMLIISFSLPEQWLHPFGGITKNLPLLVATWIMYILEQR